MHITQDLNERLRDERERRIPDQNETVHYWQVERRTRRGGWKFHSEHYCTKSEIVRIWKNFFFQKMDFRLRHLLSYGERHGH